MPTPTPVHLSPEALEFFGFKDDPFADPDVPIGWSSPALDAVRKQLVDAVRKQRMIAIVGEAGAGKSTLRRLVVAQLRNHARFIQPSTLARGRIDTTVLTEAIVRELAGRSTSSMSTERRSHLLQTTLAERRAAGDFPTLVIDEAHRLRTRGTEREPSPLIALKTLWDSSFTGRNLAIILAGQPILEHELLHNIELVEVARRMQIIRMPALDPKRPGAGAADYLAWRLKRVNGDLVTLFDGDAIAALQSECATPLAVYDTASRLLSYAHSIGATQVKATFLARC